MAPEAGADAPEGRSWKGFYETSEGRPELESTKRWTISPRENQVNGGGAAASVSSNAKVNASDRTKGSSKPMSGGNVGKKCPPEKALTPMPSMLLAHSGKALKTAISSATPAVRLFSPTPKRQTSGPNSDTQKPGLGHKQETGPQHRQSGSLSDCDQDRAGCEASSTPASAT
ncbi:unnamed protein product [Protopolystoma xenopodis]|uniref:Uncharacterized protein n=1 Tax=Protopolystoma xenopodis TaxID=117903 RepID=A0A448X467_9PLAT|nr:unnamed protein product [Protopolystoma xenopodis]